MRYILAIIYVLSDKPYQSPCELAMMRDYIKKYGRISHFLMKVRNRVKLSSGKNPYKKAGKGWYSYPLSYRLKYALSCALKR